MMMKEAMRLVYITALAFVVLRLIQIGERWGNVSVDTKDNKMN